MTLPTDPHKRLNTDRLTLVAVLIVALMQLAGFVHSASRSGARDAQFRAITDQLEQTRAALAADDATIRTLRDGLDRLANQKHVTPQQIRRLQAEAARPQPTVTATVPGPRVTVTRTAHPKPTRHRPPSPSCTPVPGVNRCLPTIPVRLGATDD